MKLSEQTQAAQEFIEELREQMSEDVRMLFDMVIHRLEQLSPEVKERLDFLECLEAHGVDNWDGYEMCLPELDEEDDEELDEEDDE